MDNEFDVPTEINFELHEQLEGLDLEDQLEFLLDSDNYNEPTEIYFGDKF